MDEKAASHIQASAAAIGPLAIGSGMTMLDGPHAYWSWGLISFGVLVLAADAAWAVHQLLQHRVGSRRLRLALVGFSIAILSATGGYAFRQWLGPASADTPVASPTSGSQPTGATPPGAGQWGHRDPRANIPLPSSFLLREADVQARSKIKPCKDPLEISPEKILKDMRSYSAFDDPFQRVSRYRFSCVDWKLPLAWWSIGSETLRMTFDTPRRGVGVIGLQVRTEDYSGFASGKEGKGKLIRVHGVISGVDSEHIWLRDVVLDVLNEPPPPEPAD
jgi:hypothetical protein